MSRVFVSSLVGGMEEFRQTARQAIQTMDCTPMMCEDFGARPYSSETACIHEVEQSEIYLLILGEKYGYVTPDGISVTQTEFRAAKETGKPILAFIQTVDSRGERQQSFLQEVEDYQDGVFRSSFTSVLELNNGIIAALRQIETMQQSISENDFGDRINSILEKRYTRNDDPELVLAFLPQPARNVDIVSIEQRMDEYFGLLSKAGVTQLRDGYNLVDHPHWTGFTSGPHSLYFCPDGLILLICNPTLRDREDLFAGSFAPPENISSVAKGFRSIIDSTSGYLQVALLNMESTYVANRPSGNSMTMRTYAEDNEQIFNKLFVPLTRGNYEGWIDQCVKRFARIFAYNNR